MDVTHSVVSVGIKDDGSWEAALYEGSTQNAMDEFPDIVRRAGGRYVGPTIRQDFGRHAEDFVVNSIGAQQLRGIGSSKPVCTAICQPMLQRLGVHFRFISNPE